VAARSLDAAAAADTQSVWWLAVAILSVLGSGGEGRLDVSAFAADGFTLIVDAVVGADITVLWEAWWGDDITVNQVGDVSEPSGTGSVDYSGNVPGFVSTDTDDQVLMFFGVDSALTSGTIESGRSSGFMVGFASGGATAENVVVAGASQDAAATMLTRGYCKTGECLAMMTSGNPTARATCTRFITDGFTLNWIARALTNRRYIFAGLKGGNWRAGALTIDGSAGGATASLAGLSWAPVGLSLIGRGSVEQSAGVSDNNDRLAVGGGTSVAARQTLAVLDENGTADAEIDTAVEYDQALAYVNASGSTASKYDIDAMGAAGFTLINDLAGGVASEWIGYLAFAAQLRKFILVPQ
jgi:hypothetical protein